MRRDTPVTVYSVTGSAFFPFFTYFVSDLTSLILKVVGSRTCCMAEEGVVAKRKLRKDVLKRTLTLVKLYGLFLFIYLFLVSFLSSREIFGLCHIGCACEAVRGGDMRN